MEPGTLRLVVWFNHYTTVTGYHYYYYYYYFHYYINNFLTQSPIKWNEFYLLAD
jgi:hypothetical protein